MSDSISRQAAIDAVRDYLIRCQIEDGDYHADGIMYELDRLPSVQSEQRCLNCGRTAKNGGWYEDGGTRCPIEEHYKLPKDGYCHLWEKRNVWDDDYVKRSEEGEK